jgi:hypothetical protein
VDDGYNKETRRQAVLSRRHAIPAAADVYDIPVTLLRLLFHHPSWLAILLLLVLVTFRYRVQLRAALNRICGRRGWMASYSVSSKFSTDSHVI